MKLQNQKAIITGGSRGLGFAVAESLVAEGAAVALIARDKEELEAAKDKLKEKFSSAEIFEFVCDVSREEEVKSTAELAIKDLGGVNILVNTAGIYGPIGASLDVDINLWRKAYEINVFGSFYMIREVGRVMRENKAGVIINFSGGGDGPLPNFSAYNSSKLSIVRLTETLAEEFKDFGVRINCIAPGAVNTKFLEEALLAGEEKVGKEKYQKLLKQKEEGGTPPEKTGELCAFLASPEAVLLTGKFFSAAWDKWQEWDESKIKEIMSSNAFTERRVDPYRKD